MKDGNNFAAALAMERRRVVRCFHKHDSRVRADLAASFRLGPNQRVSLGEYFFAHPDLPNLAFPTRKAAAVAALTKLEQNKEKAGD